MKCSQCKFEVSDHLMACPQCGRIIVREYQTKSTSSSFRRFLERSSVMNINWGKYGLFEFFASIFVWIMFAGLLKKISPVLCFIGGIILGVYGICYWLKNNPQSKVRDRWTAVIIASFGLLTIYVSFYQESYRRDNSDIRGAVEMLNEVKGKSLPEAIQIWHEGK